MILKSFALFLAEINPLFNRLCFCNLKTQYIGVFKDLTKKESIIVFSLAVLTLLTGLQPYVILSLLDHNVQSIVVTHEYAEDLEKSLKAFDDYIRDEPFIQEFITMVNTIDWPERTGPNITIRGCTLVKISDNKSTVFYKVGSNPPKLLSDNDETTEEPQILQSNVFKDISLVSTQDDSEQLVTEDKVDFDL